MSVNTANPKSDATVQDVQKAAQFIINIPSDDPNYINNHYSSFINSLQTLYKSNKLESLVPVLPLLLRLKGQPYSLHRHFPMEPLFSLTLPKKFLVKSGRQVSKSTTLAAQGIIQGATLPYFSALHIAPRWEQIRRFSNNYVRPFLINSPLRATLQKEGEQSVLQRTFKNGSALHFSFAFLDADRVRGHSADIVRYDEIQDIDITFIPIINETLSASDYALEQYAGTPKTFDNTIEALWGESSQAEWVIRCRCGRWNVACVTEDLLKMIQKPGLSCAKCGLLLDAAAGHWEHRVLSRRYSFPGYHVPQAIMPMHYEPNPFTKQREKWHTLWSSKESMDKAKFYNEKLGESCDVRVSLVSQGDLQNASVLRHDNRDIKEAVKRIGEYPTRTMGIDWGGGGKDGVSYTAIAIMGHNSDGRADLLYGERLNNIADPAEEAAIILRYFAAFRCSLVGHDFGGAGSIRETLMIQSGFPMDQIFPASYVVASAAPIVSYKG